MLAHHLEDLVAPHRRESAALPPTVADLLLSTLDVYLQRLDAWAEGRGAELSDIGPVLVRLASALNAPATPSAAAPLASASVAEAEEERARAEESSWRVTRHQVHVLVREVERLRELQLRLDERKRELNRLVEDSSLSIAARAVIGPLESVASADAAEAGDLVQALEEGIKGLSTLPVRTVIEPLHRAVRDLCRQLGKEARLQVVGSEISVDRRVLEALRGPVVQLVRNAVDHGVELPEVREARGKHREALLAMRVEQTGNILLVELSDDGAGLDPARIREAALRRGVSTPAELAAMTDHQIQQLIFTSGFSTRGEVTETSGRGVGLDVVRNQLAALSGRVEVHSVPGQGTRFTLTLAVELGSSPVMVVRCGETQIGLPMLAVEAIVSLKQEQLRIGRSHELLYAETLLPLRDLGVLLGLREPSLPTAGTSALIIQQGGVKLALWVDEIEGQRDLVIRSLPSEIRQHPAYQGASTLSRGELMLVLRPDWLVADGQRRGGEETQRRRRALVVDDSLTARALLRAALEAGGFQVHVAGSAAQALQHLRRGSYEVMVTDITMPEMSGPELIAAVRSHPDTRQLPVVLVSVNDDGADRGEHQDADGFLSKRDCAAGRLLGEVTRAIALRRGMA